MAFHIFHLTSKARKTGPFDVYNSGLMVRLKQRVYEILGHLKAPGPGFYLYTNRGNFSFSRKLNKFPKKSKHLKIKMKNLLCRLNPFFLTKNTKLSSFLGENPAGLQLNSSPDQQLRSLHFILLLATFVMVQNFRWRNYIMIQNIVHVFFCRLQLKL